MAQKDALEEKNLIRRAAAGNASSLEQLIGRYYDTIHAFCCRRIGDSFTGADVCQETFFKMVQHLPYYKEQGYFKSWLFAIASNCCNDAFRKKRPAMELNTEVADKKQPFEQNVADAALIKEALNKLPADQKEVVILRYYHDFSTKDVARVQRVPAATVKTRLHRGIRKLKKILGEEILLET